MRKHLLLLTLALACCAAQAQSRWEQVAATTKVVIWNNDGTNYTVDCAQQPTLELDSTYLMVSYADTELRFPATEVRKFTFSADDQTSVGEVARQANFSILPDAIALSGLKQDTPVMVYDTAGRLVARSKADEGQASVNTSNLPRGIYAVKAGSINFKFLKR